MFKPLASIISPNVGYSLSLLTLLLIAVGWAATLNLAQAQSANGVYDTDGDGLIEVSNLAQLDAIRYDSAGEGSPSADNRVAYYGAFPGAVAGMGCPNGECTGYELVADLDFDTNGSGQADTGDAYWNDGAGWEPIGSYSATLDGNGHTVANLFINRTNEDDVGLFGSSGGVIQNIGLLAANVAGGSDVGGLVGSLAGSINGSYATGAVAGSGHNVGGLVGDSDTHSRIDGSYATGTVTGGGDYVGGLVGDSIGSISDSHATGTVTGSGDYIGGLVGSLFGGYFSSSISDSHATGSVTGGGDYVGGLVGLLGHSDNSISGSYATGTVAGSGDYVGGLVGYSGSGSGRYSISGSYATGSVTGEGDVGGLVGYSGSGISGSYAAGAVIGSGDNVGGLVGSLGHDSSISGSYAMGAVAGSGDNVGGLVGSLGYGDSSIGGSYATGAVTGSGDNVGGLVGSLGYGDSSISGSYATGTVAGEFSVGGLVGVIGVSGGKISASYATGYVSGTAAIGGLVGSSTGTTTDSYWDTETSGQLYSDGGSGKTTAELQSPAGYTGIYAAWDDTEAGDLWDFGESSQYPALKADLDGNGTATAWEFGGQGRVAPVTPGSGPMVDLSLDNSQPLKIRIDLPVPVIATFTKAVSGFTASDVTVVNGTVGNFAAGARGMVYTFDVTPNAIAAVTVDISAGVAADSDGNGNAAALHLSFTPYDDDGVPGIGRAEVITAIRDYFSGKLTRAQAIAVIRLYFASGS